MDDRTQRIEAAIVVFQLSIEYLKSRFDVKCATPDEWIASCKSAYNATLKAKNELYDAIGGMEDYKYNIQGE